MAMTGKTRYIKTSKPLCFDYPNYKLQSLIFNWDQIVVMSNLGGTVLWVGNLNCNFFSNKNIFDFNVRPRKLLKSERLRVSKQKLLVQNSMKFPGGPILCSINIKAQKNLLCHFFIRKISLFACRTYISSVFGSFILF